MKIDCHTHTTPYSPCSILSPDDLLNRACDSGLDAVVLTEHEVFWPREEYMWLKEAFPDLKIFRGVETAIGLLGHVIVLPPETDDKILTLSNSRDLADYLNQTGSYAFVAHPFRFDREFERRITNFLLPGVEVASFNMHDSEAVEKSLEFARRHDVLPVAASDAHSAAPIGKYYMELEANEVQSEVELIRALKQRHCRPVAPILNRLEETLQ